MTRRQTDTVRCPKCKSRRLRSTDSIPLDDGSVMRHRVCSDCGKGWTTVERIEAPAKKRTFGKV